MGSRQERTYRNYTDQDIIRQAKQSISMADLLRSLGLKPAGGNYANMKRILQKLDIDCSHWKGHAWSKDEQLKDWSDYKKASSLKPFIIKERGHCCESCGLTHWKNQPITLEIDHIDGDRTNNDRSNLRLLCPNCHALTDTWRGKKNRGDRIRTCNSGQRISGLSRLRKPVPPRPQKDCPKCHQTFTPDNDNQKYCSTLCSSHSQRKVERPSIEQIHDDLKTLGSYCAVGRKYGVSDNAVRKWLR